MIARTGIEPVLILKSILFITRHLHNLTCFAGRKVWRRSELPLFRRRRDTNVPDFIGDSTITYSFEGPFSGFGLVFSHEDDTVNFDTQPLGELKLM